MKTLFKSLMTLLVVFLFVGQVSAAEWSIEIVDQGEWVGWSTSIAVDSSRVHISYYDATNKDLKYATLSDGGWNTQTIESEGDVGVGTSLAVTGLIMGIYFLRRK